MSSKKTRSKIYLAWAVLAVAAPGFLLAGGITTDGVVESTSGGFQFPDATVQTTAAVTVGTPISSVPFTIDQAGFYYLTGNQAMVGTGSAIEVNAGDVVLDLMGFTLDGDGFGDYGVFASGSDSVVIRNGTVREFNEAGIRVQSQPYRIVGVTAIANGGEGIHGGNRGVVSHCLAFGNGEDGIRVASSTLVRDSMSAANTLIGIRSGPDSVVRDCTAPLNQDDGIKVATGSSIESSTAATNTDVGFSLSEGASLSDSVARQNGSHGIQTSGGAEIVDNVALDNGHNGIFGNSGDAILDNSVRGNNTIGDPAGGGIRVDNAGALIRGNTLTENAENNIFVSATDCVIEENIVIGSKRGIQFDSGNDGNFYGGNRLSGQTVSDFVFNSTTQTDGGDNVSF